MVGTWVPPKMIELSSVTFKFREVVNIWYSRNTIVRYGECIQLIGSHAIAILSDYKMVGLPFQIDFSWILSFRRELNHFTGIICAHNLFLTHLSVHYWFIAFLHKEFLENVVSGLKFRQAFIRIVVICPVFSKAKWNVLKSLSLHPCTLCHLQLHLRNIL